jgi:predicted nucleic acid-binding protein
MRRSSEGPCQESLSNLSKGNSVRRSANRIAQSGDGWLSGSTVYSSIPASWLPIREKGDEFLEIAAVSPDVATAEIYARIAQTLEVKGTPIPENDIWIAAVALECDMPLATRDDHFRQVDRLDILSSARTRSGSPNRIWAYNPRLGLQFAWKPQVDLSPRPGVAQLLEVRGSLYGA